jgi:hypothetical protein
MTVQEHEIEEALRMAKVMLDRARRFSDGYAVYCRVEFLAQEVGDVLKKFVEKHQ